MDATPGRTSATSFTRETSFANRPTHVPCAQNLAQSQPAPRVLTTPLAIPLSLRWTEVLIFRDEKHWGGSMPASADFARDPIEFMRGHIVAQCHERFA